MRLSYPNTGAHAEAVLICDQTFASRTKNNNHKRYMCKQCKISISHNVELHIQKNKTFYTQSATAKVTKQVSVACSEKFKPPTCTVFQALQCKCPEWHHHGEKRDDAIKHMKNIRPFQVHLRLEDRFQPIGRPPNIHFQQTNWIALCNATEIILRPM